jgi:hypothetical protein
MEENINKKNDILFRIIGLWNYHNIVKKE